MQGCDVAKKGNQCPGFLRVPAPESPPRIVRPNTAQYGAGSEQQDAKLQYAIEPEMHRRVSTRAARIARIAEEQDVTETHCQGEGGVAERNREDVNGEPEIIAQHRHQRIDARRHGDRHLMHQQERDECDRNRSQ